MNRFLLTLFAVALVLVGAVTMHAWECEPYCPPPGVIIDLGPVPIYDIAARRPIIQARDCPGGVCTLPSVPVAALPAAKPPAATPKPPTLPGARQAAAEPPFPGPTPTVPRVLWLYDNGVVWEPAAKCWHWQDAAGKWYHLP